MHCLSREVRKNSKCLSIFYYNRERSTNFRNTCVERGIATLRRPCLYRFYCGIDLIDLAILVLLVPYCTTAMCCAAVCTVFFGGVAPGIMINRPIASEGAKERTNGVWNFKLGDVAVEVSEKEEEEEEDNSERPFVSRISCNFLR